MSSIDLNKIVDALRSGKVVIHNTDTCLGMAVDIFNEAAVRKLYEVKKMSLDKPVSIICADLEMAQKFGVFTSKALNLAKAFLPGALTIIVKKAESFPKYLNPGIYSVGIRIPNHIETLAVVSAFGRPITTTSCNVSGERVCVNENDVKSVFLDAISNSDLFLANIQDSGEKVSTIIDLSGDEPKIIRVGGISEDLLREYLN